jgi:ATP-dependent protease ClpP protease subunit
MQKQMLRLRHEVKMSAENEAEIMVYSEIVSPGWKWDESEMSAADFDKKLKEVKGASKLKLRINSPGGTATEAVAMRAMLLSAGFEEINVEVEGLCASAATLLCCLPGAHVRMAEGSYFMIHNPWSIAFGNAEQIERTAIALRKMEDDFTSIYQKQCGKNEEQIKSWMDDETWFTAKEAVDAGFAHEVLEAEPIAATVAPDMMGAMKNLYLHTPEAVAVQNTVSTGKLAVAANKPAEHKENNSEEETEHMDISKLTLEELQAQNPALFQALIDQGGESERQRIQEIDDLTPPGYEAIAEEAKANKTSALEYHKRIVKAQKEKSDKFLENRIRETAPAAQVPGGASEDETGKEAEEKAIQANAKEIAAFAERYSRGVTGGGMY